MKKKDDIRDLLGKIRKLQNENHQITTLNSDDIRKRLDESKSPVNKLILLKEEEVQNVTSDEQREEENKFKDVVSKLVKFDEIQVYRQNVTWGGFLVREKIKWTFSLDENNGCYISTESLDMLQLTTEVIELLKKLRGYYEVWSDEWSSRLTGSPKEGGEGEGSAAPEGGETAAETTGGFGV